MEFSRSAGTNILPGDCVPVPAESATISEPRPSSSPLALMRDAPDQFITAGKVKIAASSMYSQLPENGRRDTTCTRCTPSAPWDATSAGSRSAAAFELPIGSGLPASGASSLSRPKPLP